jgi:hypothetical protein
VLAATTQGSLVAIPFLPEESSDKKWLYQDSDYQAITDLDLTKCGSFAAFCISDKIVVLKIANQQPGQPSTSSISDIKLLNTFVVNEQYENDKLVSFDVLSANGRQELIKTPVNVRDEVEIG